MGVGDLFDGTSAQGTVGEKKKTNIFVSGLVHVMFWKNKVILRPCPKHLPKVI